MSERNITGTYLIYDDAKPIIELFNTYPNVRMVNANTANGVVQHG